MTRETSPVGLGEDPAVLVARRHRDEILLFQEALTSSRQLGVAMGIVMAQEGLGRDDALALLIRATADSNCALTEIAAHVEVSGRLLF